MLRGHFGQTSGTRDYEDIKEKKRNSQVIKNSKRILFKLF